LISRVIVAGAFFTIGIFVSPLLMCIACRLPVTVEKTAGTISRAAGRERPNALFGRLKAEKVGSLPPDLVFFSASLFSLSCRLFPRFLETYAHHKVKKMVKTKLKCVIPTFFTCFAGSFLLGWSDPRFTLGTEPCAKVGSLQPSTVFCPCPN
jgi:hypothetical protein